MNSSNPQTEDLHDEFEPDETGAEDLAADGGDLDPETMRAERDEALVKLQRARADYQNLKRRSQSDYENGLRRSLQPLAESLLLVLDNLDMALATPTESEDAGNLALGVRLTRDQLLAALATLDIQPIDSEGEFDPAVHQAVQTVEVPGASPGSIVAVQRQGFRWRYGVLRYAQVVVAAGEAEPRESSGPDSLESGA